MAKTGNNYVLPQNNGIKFAILTAAKAARSGSTDAVKIADAAADGSLVKKVWALPRDTLASAAQLQLYVSPDNGTTLYLIDSVLMAAYTYNANQVITVTEFTNFGNFDEPLFLPASHSLWAASAVALAAGIVVSALLEHYTVG